MEGQAQWANKTIWDAFSGILAFRLLTARLRHLGSGTWQPAILEYRLLAAGLRHLGLGTWQPAVPEYKLLAAGLRHLGHILAVT